MYTKSHNRLIDPIKRASSNTAQFVRERPKSVAGILLLGVAVGVLIWAWPEIQRTIRIHRM